MDKHEEELMRELAERGEGPEEVREARDAARLLDALGADERRTTAAANELGEAPGDALVESTLRRLAGAHPSPRWFARPGVWSAVAAAAAVFLLALSFLQDRQAEPSPLLGNGEVELEAPVGSVEDYTEFRWRGPEAGPGRYEIIVTAADGTADPPLAHETRLQETRWSPGAAADNWPDEIRWRVVLYDESGDVLGGASAEASLSPR